MPNTTKMVKIHPATYSQQLYAPIATILERELGEKRLGSILYDPMAGLGHGLAEIAALAGMEAFGLEIEGGYFSAGAVNQCVIRGDARTYLPWKPYLAAVTSPPYPNGMTDNWHAKDDSARHTYIHRLRSHVGPDYELRPDNPAGCNARRSEAAMAEFYVQMAAIWAGVRRCVAGGGLLIVNAKDTPHEPFVSTTVTQLMLAGFYVQERLSVPTPGLNHGVGHEGKADHEVLLVCRAA